MTKMRKDVIEKIAALMTAAFGLVAALAWNAAISALFVGPCGSENAGALCMLSAGGPWVYAVIVTIVAVVAMIWIGKAAEKVAPKDKK
jgi:hypothetical protein